jgi:hypothetical protein
LVPACWASSSMVSSVATGTSYVVNPHVYSNDLPSVYWRGDY